MNKILGETYKSLLKDIKDDWINREIIKISNFSYLWINSLFTNKKIRQVGHAQ